MFTIFLLTTIWVSCSRDKLKEPSLPDVSCDTIVATYTGVVKNILDNSCANIGCHNEIGPAAGIVLSNFSGARAGVDNGKVICTMRHQSGCVPMPPGAPRLADSLIRAVECWKENGFPN
jgi:hypothetical protein